MMQKYQKRFAEKKIETLLERHVAFRSGKTVDIELSNSFIEMEEGRSLLLSLVRDVTVRKQAEERERRANAELARSQSELRKKNEILEDDLKMARDIQQAILPQQYPTFPAGAAGGRQACFTFVTAIIPADRSAGISSTCWRFRRRRRACLSAM
jgi:serine phosphatase RsbU (regulator of sigma subunit)